MITSEPVQELWKFTRNFRKIWQFKLFSAARRQYKDGSNVLWLHDSESHNIAIGKKIVTLNYSKWSSGLPQAPHLKTQLTVSSCRACHTCIHVFVSQHNVSLSSCRKESIVWRHTQKMATADIGGESIVRTDLLDHFSSTELRTASSYSDQFGEEADLSVWQNCRHVFAVWPTRYNSDQW